MMPRMRMPMRAPHPMGRGHPGGHHGAPMPHRAPHIPPHGRPGPPGHMTGHPPRPSMAPGPIPPAAVGSVTNDPSTAGARVFVGNLNTIALSKEGVEGIFKRYGMVTGLSMHKGYAFIQYGRQADARRACINEDGKMYANQTLGNTTSNYTIYWPNDFDNFFIVIQIIKSTQFPYLHDLFTKWKFVCVHFHFYREIHNA